MAADAFRGGFSTGRPDQPFDLVLTLPDALLLQPEAAQREIFEFVRGTIELILTDAAGRLSELAPVGVSGNLAQSFLANPAGPTGGIEITAATFDDIGGRVFSSLPYAIVMDQGRRIGGPISREGIDAIGLWAERKLGMSPEQAARAKWAIATNIRNRGIEGKQFAAEAFAAGEQKWMQMLNDLGQDIADALAGPGSVPASQ